MRLLTGLLLALLAILIAAPARAADPLPGSALQLQILSRSGDELSVQITNPSDDVAHFDPVGLYFVPEVGGVEPQRLGVVSAPRAANGDGVAVADAFDVAPHRSITVQLTSYCLDAQRAAPSAQTRYHLANRRMPAALSTALAGAAKTITNLGYDPEGMRPDPRGRSQMNGSAAIQRAIWRIRGAMPVPLVGDTSRDTTKPTPQQLQLTY